MTDKKKTVDKQRDNNVGGITGKGWEPGKSGNPSGRPKKGTAIADILNTKLDEQNRREKILEKVIQLALEGDKWAVEFIADRTEGKALERIQQKVELDEVVINE